MRYITIQKPVAIKSMTNGRPVLGPDGEQFYLSFKEFFYGQLCDAQFGQTLDTVVLMLDIKAAFEDAESSKRPVSLPEAHWELLCKVTKEPSANRPYNPDTIECFMSFIHAIVDASSKKPKLGKGQRAKGRK